MDHWAISVLLDSGYTLPAWAQWLTVAAALVAAAGAVWTFMKSTARPLRRVRQTFWRMRPVYARSINLTEIAIYKELSSDPVAQWTTGGMTGRVVTTNHAGSANNPEPTRIDFKKPVRQTIRKADLAAEVPGRRGDMIVRKFIPGGFVVDEGDCLGDTVEVHLFF